MLLKTALFWSITQREVVTTYQRFRKTYRSYLQKESSSHLLAAEASNRPHVVFVSVCLLLLLVLLLLLLLSSAKNILFKHRFRIR
jgi:hypothetical protein